MGNEIDKKWEDLTIANEFLFAKTMLDESICSQLLESILKIKIAKINYYVGPKTGLFVEDPRCTRLDLYVRGEERILDIEIQLIHDKDTLDRRRNYLRPTNLSDIMNGKLREDSKEYYMIFICTFDPFGDGYPIYMLEITPPEGAEQKIGKGSHHICVNATAFAKEKNENLRSFMLYLMQNHNK